MSHWSQCVNEQLGSTGIANISAYTESLPYDVGPPIDAFYASLGALLRAGDTAALTAHPVLGPLIVLGIISATEDYIRGGFAGILKICQTSRKKASEHNITFGSVLWHGLDELERSALEHTTFSDPKNIVNMAAKFISYDLKKGPLAVHLGYFEQVCELRHCIVHSGGYVQGKNAIALELPPTASRLKVRLAFAEVQETAAICAGMVRAFNTELFLLTVRRWASNWRGSPSWDPRRENQLFSTVWHLFYSNNDGSRGTLAPSYGLVRCRNAAKREFGR